MTKSESVWREVERLAEGVRADDPKLTREQAIRRATELFPDLAARHSQAMRDEVGRA